MTIPLIAGVRAPGFSLPDQSGGALALDDLRGRRVIVYFYPRAFTPGCTTQACDFRDNLASLAASGYAVVGISPDAPGELGGFAEEHALGFPLLSDEDGAVARAWGAWRVLDDGASVALDRSTVVVDEEGVVLHAQYGVGAVGHVAALRAMLDRL